MAYVLRRLGFFILTLWAALTLNFLIPRLQPGDPAEQIVRRISGQGRTVDPAQVQAVRQMLGLKDQSLLEQYVEYWKALVQGNFGISYSNFPYTVTHMIGQTMPWTLVLIGVTTLIGFVVGTLLGAWAAWKRNGPFDSVVSLSSTFLGTLPFFWIALVLLYFGAFRL